MPRSPRHSWSPDDIGDLTGQVALVTGSNSGIGLETALELAAHGAHTILACRDRLRAASAADRIAGSAPGSSVEILCLDLAEQDSVRRAAAEVDASQDRLDILVNNAGLMATPFEVTTDGFELQFATNHLGPFAFTGLLMGLLSVTRGARIVTVSSVMHRMGRIGRPDPQRLGGGYEPWSAYANTKLANLLFAYELDRRLRGAGVEARSVAAHPGWTRSNLGRNGLGASSGMWRRVGFLRDRLGQSAPSGALPVLYAATAEDVQGGEYFGPATLDLVGPPRRASSSGRSHRDDLARELWEWSEELTGVRYDLAPVAPVG